MGYFKETEFKMGKEIVYKYMRRDFLNKLEMLRELLGLPIVITSSYRTKEYCLAEGIKYSPGSQHNFGNAVDIDLMRYTGEERRKLISLAIALGLTVGVAKTFIHLDNRTEPTVFGY